MIFLKLSPRARNSLAFTYDLLVTAAGWWFAFWLRYNLEDSREFFPAYAYSVPWVLLIHGALFWRMGLYRGLWRYASLPDLRRILATVSIAAMATPAFFLFMSPPVPIPRTGYVILPLLLLLAMGGSRIAYRAWKEHGLVAVVRAPNSNPTIVLGAGDAAARLLQELAAGREFHVVALLDDDKGKQGGEIRGVKVIGPLEIVGGIAERFNVTQAIIAMPGESHPARKRAVDLCTASGLKVMTVPSYAELVSGRLNVSQLRRVELDDLLGRDPVQLDDNGLHALIDGTIVMVTGAGGSIGSELCRQIARYAPAKIVLFELSEFALYSILTEFQDQHPEVDVVAVIGDVKSRARVSEVISLHAPQIIFHAAAYKHVPLMEQGNAFEAVQNNVVGTLVCARAAREAGVRKFVLVSTDKAVNPTNVMGATKRLAELVCQSLQAEAEKAGDVTTQFVIVRFGNVLGSAGSVIPRFKAQIAAGGPVTVTHPEIIRYFMSIPEAAQLVLQAALMGASGQIFVLDMGEPVKILDLARSLIRLSGLSEGDIEIAFSGLRPGEKLFEELLSDDEHTISTPHPKLRIAKTGPSERIGIEASALEWICRPNAPDSEVRSALKRYVPGYGRADRADMADARRSIPSG